MLIPSNPLKHFFWRTYILDISIILLARVPDANRPNAGRVERLCVPMCLSACKHLQYILSSSRFRSTPVRPWETQASAFAPWKIWWAQCCSSSQRHTDLATCHVFTDRHSCMHWPLQARQRPLSSNQTCGHGVHRLNTCTVWLTAADTASWTRLHCYRLNHWMKASLLAKACLPVMHSYEPGCCARRSAIK